jgi:hypothetical protein
MPTDKPAISFRMTEDAREILARQAHKYGLSQVAVLELLLRLLDHGILTIEEDRARAHAGKRPRRKKE